MQPSSSSAMSPPHPGRAGTTIRKLGPIHSPQPAATAPAAAAVAASTRTALEPRAVNAGADAPDSSRSASEAKNNTSSADAPAANPSMVEITALRFDAERRRAALEQKARQVQRLEAENTRLQELLEAARRDEGDRRRAGESALHVELDTVRRALRGSQDEATALGLAKSSLEARLDTAERRVSALRHLEETNAVLEKEVALREREEKKLRQDLLQAERRAQEAAQTSLANVLQGKVKALEAMVEERDSQIGELRSNCAALEATLGDLRHTHAMNLERCEALEKMVAELRVAITALKTDLAAGERLVAAQHADFSRRYEDAVGGKEHAEQRCSLLEELNGELRAEVREAGRRAQDRDFVVAEMQNELSVTRHELAAARHQAECAAEDERAAVDRMRRLQHAAADREAQIAKQQLLEQSLRGELEAMRHEVMAARGDADRLRGELLEAARRADLLSHQAAQRDGAEERSRQLERQLQRTLDEADSLRDAVAAARRREVDVESALAKHRESLALVDRLQRDLEERDAQCAALRREKELAAAELDALRNDLTRARASTASYFVPQTSPSRRPLPGRTGAPQTESVFGRHFTPPREQSPPRNVRLVQSAAEYQDQKLMAMPRALKPATTSPTLAQRRQQAAQQQYAESLSIVRPHASVFSPDRPSSAQRKGPRQQL